MKFIFSYFQTERAQVKVFTFIRIYLSTIILNYIALPAFKDQLKILPTYINTAGISPIPFYKFITPKLHKALLIVPVSS